MVEPVIVASVFGDAWRLMTLVVFVPLVLLGWYWLLTRLGSF